MCEVKGFYNEMMFKLKSLRNCPALDDQLGKDMKLDKEDAKLFKNLKHTPLVKEKLKFIEQLDEQIKQTIDTYKAERSERLETQKEMCNEIYKNNKIPGRDSQLFLDLCHFEVADDPDVAEEAHEEVTGQAEENMVMHGTENDNKRIYERDFIKRNAELAKEGIMAGYSLTDEEKKKLEELLANIDGPYSLDDEAPQDSRESGIGTDVSLEDYDNDDSEDDDYVISNAYVVDDANSNRIENIDNELEKFTLDETDKEKVERATSKLAQVELRDIMLEQRLKTINAKLAELYKSYEEDKANTSTDNSGDVSADSEASNAETG